MTPRNMLVMGASLVFLAGGCATMQDTPTRFTTVTIERPVHFSAPDGTDVMAAPGRYRVDTIEDARLQLIPAESGTGSALLTVTAMALPHAEPIEERVALSLPNGEDEHHVVLLMPDGKGLDAGGTYSGLRSRGDSIVPLLLAQLQAAIAKQTLAVRDQWTAPVGPLTPASLSQAEPSEAAPDPPAESKAKPEKKVVATVTYEPPKVGAPGRRVAGGTRDVGPAGEEVLPVLVAIAPEDHAGLTGYDQPIVYWYLSPLTTLPIRLTLLSDRPDQPVIETPLPAPTRSGLQRLAFTAFNLRLLPDLTYRWLITLGPDPASPTRYSFAGGSMVHVMIPTLLSTKLGTVKKTDVPALYAEAGYWYDSVRALSELIEAAPTDRALRQQRASLLHQVGLTDVAESDLHAQPQ